jgi:hypothetical protein
LLAEQHVEGAARGRRAHDLEPDRARRDRGHELDVGQETLRARAEHDDRRLQRQRGLEVLDRHPVRLDRRPALEDLVRADDDVARDPTLRNADASRLPSTDEVDDATVASELHGLTLEIA